MDAWQQSDVLFPWQHLCIPRDTVYTVNTVTIATVKYPIIQRVELYARCKCARLRICVTNCRHDAASFVTLRPLFT